MPWFCRCLAPSCLCEHVFLCVTRVFVAVKPAHLIRIRDRLGTIPSRGERELFVGVAQQIIVGVLDCISACTVLRGAMLLMSLRRADLEEQRSIGNPLCRVLAVQTPYILETLASRRPRITKVPWSANHRFSVPAKPPQAITKGGAEPNLPRLPGRAAFHILLSSFPATHTTGSLKAPDTKRRYRQRTWIDLPPTDGALASPGPFSSLEVTWTTEIWHLGLLRQLPLKHIDYVSVLGQTIGHPRRMMRQAILFTRQNKLKGRFVIKAQEDQGVTIGDWTRSYRYQPES
ncbi:uncharacterized protein F5147DRAFT_760603 [Suillus discolor]|uniref:Uncharacterized protein n=1 Tax=Suillus discolor TaxID=1912936 RepID=A0A9P7F7F3_9AGAM|nr:uncharacterized protein F5147DRAFT_760603 [Suillus discolor]KAG2109641.1 hypothetical protein F5147DRAFT_760603 [Suillus discolor]